MKEIWKKGHEIKRKRREDGTSMKIKINDFIIFSYLNLKKFHAKNLKII